MRAATAAEITDLALSARVAVRRTGQDLVDTAEEILDRDSRRFANLTADLDAEKVTWATVTRRIRKAA